MGLKEVLKSVLEQEIPTVSRNRRIPSAVVVPFCMAEGEPHILFLKKVDSNYPHGGQVCFPGGCWEPSDRSILETALREFEEETGINRSRVEVLGFIRPVETRSTNYIIYPFVGLLDSTRGLNHDRSEIEKAFLVPLSFLIRNHPMPVVEYRYRGAVFLTPLLEYQGEIIWGASARILGILLERLLPRLTLQE